MPDLTLPTTLTDPRDFFFLFHIAYKTPAASPRKEKDGVKSAAVKEVYLPPTNQLLRYSFHRIQDVVKKECACEGVRVMA